MRRKIIEQITEKGGAYKHENSDKACNCVSDDHGSSDHADLFGDHVIVRLSGKNIQ